MLVVRPVAPTDIPALETIAAGLTPGVHTLPRSRATIAQAVERSMASFAAQPAAPGDEAYFFVLESTADHAVAGTAAIAATAGSSGSFFAFRNDVLSQASRDLHISHDVHVLTLCSGLTACSQLSSFYLRDARSAGPGAALLSRARLLYAAGAPQRFSDRFFASMAGKTDAGGRSPFWEALGRKFFQMDFLEAEKMIEGARNRTLIVELMPHYPVYVPLLPPEAQAAMGQVHAEGELPFRILTAEGFAPDEYIDIFDGGPILQAHRNALRAFSHSVQRTASADPGGDLPRAHWLVAAVREGDFRAVLAECAVPELSGNIVLPPDAMRTLQVAEGETVLCVNL